MIIREFVGGAIVGNLSNAISNTSNSFSIVSGGASFPSGEYPKNFVVTIDRGLANEEKILVNFRSGNEFYIKERGYDGTTMLDHNSNATVTHTVDAEFLQYTSDEVNKTIILTWMGV